MKITPQVLGAVAVVAIAGAVSGATIADTPMLTRSHSDTLPEAQIVSVGNQALRSAERPPNHYPLVTPDGTIEVAELALHGRMRDRGGAMWWDDGDTDRVDLNAEYDFYATASPERIEHERRLLAFTEGPQEQSARHTSSQTVTRAEAPMALAEPVAVVVTTPAPARPQLASTTQVGGAQSVDVSAALSTSN